MTWLADLVTTVVTLVLVLAFVTAMGCTRVVVQTPPETTPTAPAEADDAR